MRGMRTTILALVPALAALAWALAWPQLHAPGAVEALGAFMGPSRWSEGRSALPLPWRPWRGTTRLGDYERLLAALYAPAAQDDPTQPLALAQQYVWRGGAGDAERAQAILEAQPESAVVWNERALVELSRGRRIEALAAIDRAIAQEGSLPAARFNRALVLEQLHLRGEAEAAWRHFLAVEPAGPWAAEAQLRMERLQRPLEKAPRNGSSSRIVRSLYLVEDAAALDAWRRQREARQLLEQNGPTSDPLVRSTVAWLRDAGEAEWAEHRRLGGVYRSWYTRVMEGRADHRKLAALAETDAPIFAVRYLQLAAYDALQRQERAAARELLERLLERCGRFGCGEEAILARSDLGNLLLGEGDFHGAERAFDAAFAALPQDAHVRRAELLTKRSIVAKGYGAEQQAVELLLESVRLSELAAGDHPLAASLLNLSHHLAGRGMPSVVAAFARESRRVAERAGIARLAQKAQANLAAALREEGRLEEAAAVLEVAWAEAQAAAVPPVLGANRLGLALVRLEEERPAEALALLDEAERSFGEGLDPRHRIRLAQARASALEQQGELRGAAAQLEREAAEVAAQAARLPSPLARQLVGAAASDSIGRLALLRGQLDGVGAGWEILAPRGRRQLAADECLVAPTRLPAGRTVLFVATRSNAFFEVVPVAVPAVDLLARSRCGPGTRRITLLDTMATDAAPMARVLRRLHPEVAVLLAGDALQPWPDGGVSGPALVVHSPRPTQSDRGLAFLYGAAREAASIAATLPEVRELRYEAATPAGVRAEAGRAGLLHFAVHGDGRMETGAASHLVLAGEAGRLQVVDVLGLQLREKRPVVVLSACRSGGRSADPENDGAGLTWAFLHAGARAVIAHQDDLRDDVGLAFAASFYPAIARGAGLSAAFEAALAGVRKEHGAAAAEGFLLSF